MFNAGQWRWPAWWRALQPSLSDEAQPVYRQQIAQLQRDLLILLVVLAVTLGTLYSLQLGYAAFGPQRGSIAAFVVNTTNVLLSLICTLALMRRGKLAAVWSSIVALSFISILLEITILCNPGILLFALLNLTGLALFAPVRVTAALVGVLVAALLVLTRVLDVGAVADWFNVASLVGVIMVVVDLHRRGGAARSSTFCSNHRSGASGCRRTRPAPPARRGFA